VDVRLAVIGRVRDAGLASVMGEYEHRASRYWTWSVRELKEGVGASPAVVKRAEGARLLDAMLERSQLVACDERGRSLTSPEFAAWMGRQRDAGSSLSFVIGGAHGLDEPVLARAALRLSLAPWTLPHEMARLVLTEQLYRAGTILRGEPYHKP
jgi:23S rRNA (pseudouridine1915-N3)-methyltransferase